MRLLHPDIVECSLGVAGTHCAIDMISRSDDFTQEDGDFKNGLPTREIRVDQLNVLHLLRELGCCCCRTATSVTLQPNSELSGQVATLQDDTEEEKYRSASNGGKSFAPFPPRAVVFSRALAGCCSSNATTQASQLRRLWLGSIVAAVLLPATLILLETVAYQALWVLPPVRHPEVLLRAFGEYTNSTFSGGFGDSSGQKWRLALFFCINSIPVLVAPLHFMLLNTHVPSWSKQPIAIGLAVAGVVTVLLVVEIIPRALSMYPLFGLALPAAVMLNLIVQTFQFTHVLSSKFLKRSPREHAEEFAARERQAQSLVNPDTSDVGDSSVRNTACCKHFSTEMECSWDICACFPSDRCARRTVQTPQPAAVPRMLVPERSCTPKHITTLPKQLSEADSSVFVAGEDSFVLPMGPVAGGGGAGEAKHLNSDAERPGLDTADSSLGLPKYANAVPAAHSLPGATVIELPGVRRPARQEQTPLNHRQQAAAPPYSSRSAGDAHAQRSLLGRDTPYSPAPMPHDQQSLSLDTPSQRSGSVASFTSSVLSEMTHSQEPALPRNSLPTYRRTASLAMLHTPSNSKHGREFSVGALAAARPPHTANSLLTPFSADADSKARSPVLGAVHMRPPFADEAPREQQRHRGGGRSSGWPGHRQSRFASAPNLSSHDLASQKSSDSWADLRPSAGLSMVAGMGGALAGNTEGMARRLALLGWHPRKLSIDFVEESHSAAWEGSMIRRQWWSILHSVAAVVLAFGSALTFRTTFSNAHSPVMQVLLNVFIVSALAFMRFVVLHTTKWSRSGSGERCSCLRSMLPLTSERCLQCIFELNLRLAGTDAQGSGSSYTPTQPDPRFVWRGYHIVEVALAGAERRLAPPLSRVKLQHTQAPRALYTLQPMPATQPGRRHVVALQPRVRAVLHDDRGVIDDSAPYHYSGYHHSGYSDASVNLPAVGTGAFHDLNIQQLVAPIKLPPAKPCTQVRLHLPDGQTSASSAGALLLPSHMPQPLHAMSTKSPRLQQAADSPHDTTPHDAPQTLQPHTLWSSTAPSPGENSHGPSHSHGRGPSGGSSYFTGCMSAESSPPPELRAPPLDVASAHSWSAPPSTGSDPFKREADRPPSAHPSRVSFASWDGQGGAAEVLGGTTPLPPKALPLRALWRQEGGVGAQRVEVNTETHNSMPVGHLDEEHRSVSGVAAQVTVREVDLFHALPVIHLNLWSNESQDRLVTMFITMILELFTAFALTDIVSPVVFGVLLVWQCSRALAAHGVRFVLSSEHQRWAMQRFAARLPLIGARLGWMLDRIAVDRVSNLDVRIAYYKLLLQSYILQPEEHADLVRAMACVADVPVRLNRRGSLTSDVSGTLGSSVAGVPSAASSGATGWTGGGSCALGGQGVLPVLRVPALSRTTDAQIRQLMVLRSAQNSMMHMGAAIAANIFFGVALALDRLPHWPFRIRLTAFVSELQVQRGELYGAVQLPVLVISYVCCCWLMHYYRGINASAVWVSLYTHRRTAVTVIAMVLLLGQYANSFYFSPPDSDTA